MSRPKVFRATVTGSGPMILQRFDEFRERAEAGDSYAQCLLGYLIESGLGCQSDVEAAQDWYTRAAMQGFAPAQLALYLLLKESDPDDALQWLVKSAKAGYPAAQTSLAVCYSDGDQVRRDPDLAFKWMREATRSDYVPAMLGLALLYENGVGVEKDEEKSLEFYRIAAEKGNSGAAVSLGQRLVESPDETLRNEGLKWIWSAAKGGNPLALLFLSQMYRFGSFGANQDRELADLLGSLSEAKLNESE